MIRSPVFAGRFYPESNAGCREMLDDLCLTGEVTPALGAIVPHAGWVYSGQLAGAALARVAAAEPATIVLFGAAHGPDSNAASVWPTGVWTTPLGDIPIDEDLTGRLRADGCVVADERAHRREHSIEVQLPILQHYLHEFRIVPIVIRPGSGAAEVGRSVAKITRQTGRLIAFVGSTDLTHYGPSFEFEPQGRGEAGIRWAKDVNDRRIVRLIQTLAADEIVPEALSNRNACGPGAIAATVGAMVELGVTEYEELGHACSAELDPAGLSHATHSVGYEAGVFRATG